MHHSVLLAVSILIGALLLFFGRRLFWLLVAAIGFWIGFQIVPYLMHQPPPWLEFVLAILFGMIGAILAFVLQKIAIGGAGFLVGGFVATEILNAFVNYQPQFSALAFIIGGIVGAILMLVLFDWALIFFSAISGAELIVSHLKLPATGTVILLVCLIVLGIVVQSMMHLRRNTRRAL
jgi:uncharacterized membrane protein YeaQ/YmgE (transglycosylase-associated protein family)